MTYLDNTHRKPQTEIFPPYGKHHLETRQELRPENRPENTRGLDLSFAELKANPPAELSVPMIDRRGQDASPLATEPLRARVRLMVALLWKIIGARGAASMAREVKSALRQLYSEEKQAMTLWAKHALRRNPDWQARVLEDLGGQGALSRWQARLRKSFKQQPEDDYAWLDDDPADWPIPEQTRLKAKPVKTARKITPRFKTDRDGMFRWASIKLGRNGHSANPRGDSDWNSADDGFQSRWEDDGNNSAGTERSVYSDPWPIEVMPSDLINRVEDFENEDDYNTENCGSVSTDPLTLWAAMQAEHRYWYGRIIDFLQDNQFHPPKYNECKGLRFKSCVTLCYLSVYIFLARHFSLATSVQWGQ